MATRLAKEVQVTITIHDKVVQGSDEWIALRRGLITASEVSLILTPTLKVAANDKSRAHVYELLAQRISQYVEPHYVGSDMLRGEDEEILARELYAKHYAPIKEVGFITNDRWGFTIGYSPDGLVGAEGLIEAKSRRQKYQVQTIVENVMPDDYLLQVQTGLMVTERKWLDFLSYSGGLPMCVMRVHPDEKVHAAIIEAAGKAEAQIAEKLAIYLEKARTLIATERREYGDMKI
jgi:predicted phage-related endonuclease